MVKNLRICGSGIYTYDISEAQTLNLSPVPKRYSELSFVNVYRPPSVLEENKDKFARVPIIVGHHILVTPENAQSLMVGLIGDTIETELGEDGELYLYATGTLVSEKGFEAYRQYRQLSVGYDPICEWREGIHNNVKYQAVLTGFHDVNHVLICQFARGGPQCTVMDSLDYYLKEVNKMGFFDKLKVNKSSPELVPLLLKSIAFGADMETQSKQIKAICGDSTFLQGLNELKSLPKDQLLSATETLSLYYKEKVLGDEEKDIETKDQSPEDTKKDTETKDQSPEDTKKDTKKDTETKDQSPEDTKKDTETKDCGPKLSGDDMEAIVNKVVEIVMSRMTSSPAKTVGDSSPETSSNKFFSEIWGGR